MRDNTTVIILAGGLGTRLGTIGQIIPKPLMPIYDSILIEDNLRYAAKHFEKIIVSIRPESLSLFQNYSKSIKGKYEWLNRIKFTSNPNHEVSSLNALLFFKDLISTEYIAMMFSDIHFYSDPFLNLPKTIKNNLLGLTELTKIPEKKIGLAKVSGDKVTSLKYEAPTKKLNNLEWNGLTVMRTENFLQLQNFLKQLTTPVPEEEFLDKLIQNDEYFTYFKTPHFINANTNEDLFKISEMRRNKLNN